MYGNKLVTFIIHIDLSKESRTKMLFKFDVRMKYLSFESISRSKVIYVPYKRKKKITGFDKFIIMSEI